ncbi:hypothetical protein UlMin_010306 [Ulmus minor]
MELPIEEETDVVSEGKLQELFINAMKGHWKEVLETYTSLPEVQKEKITKSEDTALHIAVADGQTEVALDLVAKVEATTLEIANNQGNTPLHIAAGLGDLEICQSLTRKNSKVITFRNHNGETPLFLAALFGKEKAFIWLRNYYQGEELLRRKNGDTVLHVAISGEYFSMAIRIIKLYEKFVDSMNEYGLCPLSILASKPNAFKSSTHFGVFDRIIYNCSVVDDEVEKEALDIEQCIQISKGKRETTQSYPKNYEVCMNLLGLLNHFLQAIKKSLFTRGADEENPRQENTNRWSPPNYYSFVLFFKLMMKALLIVLGAGVWRIRKIQKKKELHVWAKRCMDELVKNTKSYKFYNSTGRSPSNTTQLAEYRNEFAVPDPRDKEHSESDKVDASTKEEKKKSEEKVKRVTSILIAAKMGVAEIVEKILDEFPVAIQDLDSDGKNVVLLAIENRQPHVYNLLMNRKVIKESVFKQVDCEGNSALHLAALFRQHRPWRISGSALQMQWEIKWFKFVKRTMPLHFFPRYNIGHETAKNVFIESHKYLVKEASEWLTKTSESCSVVAALVAAVAFSTSATVPGGVKQDSGTPTLEGRATFDTFAISSLVALCFSVTALVFFLSILTSRYREKDFATDLPVRLLLGLTSLFASIASMLISFCAGHLFVLKHELRFIAYPLYAALCIPITFFALAQLSLYFDLVWAIFKKVPQRSYEAFTC